MGFPVINFKIWGFELQLPQNLGFTDIYSKKYGGRRRDFASPSQKKRLGLPEALSKKVWGTARALAPPTLQKE